MTGHFANCRRRRVAELVGWRGVDARHYAVCVAAEASQLLGRQDVDDQRPHMRNVPGCGFGECLVALVGQDRVGKAPVFWIGLAAYKAPCLEARHQVRQPGQRRVDQVGERAHPQGSPWPIGQPGQDLVLHHPQVGVAPQLLIDRPGKPGRQADHRQPGVHLRCGQPPHRLLPGGAAGSLGHQASILITR